MAGPDYPKFADTRREEPHDYNGLLRFPSDSTPTGAYRAPTKASIEIEWRDGTLERRPNRD